MKKMFMRHRKVMALFAVVAMIAGCPAAAFADGSFGKGAAQTDRTVTSDDQASNLSLDGQGTNINNDSIGGENTAPTGRPVPVYGYVGPDALLIDEDPNDPDIGMSVKEVKINVSVPVKILWAAFENGSVEPSGTAGKVVSPDYYIRNNDKTTDLKVTVTNFTKEGTDNDVVDKDLILNIYGPAFKQTGLVTGNGSVASYLTDGTNVQLGFSAGRTWKFTIDGTYDGTFGSAKMPKYSLQLKFEVDEVV
jgi:hypothetical protein